MTINGNGTGHAQRHAGGGDGATRHSLTFTAANGVTPNATEPFTLTVDRAGHRRSAHLGRDHAVRVDRSTPGESTVHGSSATTGVNAQTAAEFT